jgi:hypothetical protein
MSVRPTDAERIHPRPQRLWSNPIAQLLVDVERAVNKINFGIRSFEMQAGRNLPMLER